MKRNIRALLLEEQKYLYPQSSQIAGQTGCIGHLYAKAEPEGGFRTLWEDEKRYLRTPEFLDDYAATVGAFRSGMDGFLKNREVMKAYCDRHPEARTESGEYAVRADTIRYAYLVRMDPKDGEEGFTLTVYKKDCLDAHIQCARRGIRFTDVRYRDLFRLTDGGKLKITYPGGAQAVETCRYIDEYHLEIGKNIYHICEFADKMAKNRCSIEPVNRETGKERAYAGACR